MSVRYYRIKLHVCSKGISPLPSAVDAIVNFARREKQRALQRYLGMINYYHRFILHCAAKLTPLNNLPTEANEGHTRLSPKSNFELKWNEGADSAFMESKQILANTTLLVHTDPSAQLNITCDASDFAVGGVLLSLSTMSGSHSHFFVKSYLPWRRITVLSIATFIAVYATIRHFRHNLEGR